jgi:hypothetical protein
MELAHERQNLDRRGRTDTPAAARFDRQRHLERAAVV